MQIVKTQHRQGTGSARLEVAAVGNLKPTVGLVFFVENFDTVTQVFQAYTFVCAVMLLFGLFRFLYTNPIVFNGTGNGAMLL